MARTEQGEVPRQKIMVDFYEKLEDNGKLQQDFYSKLPDFAFQLSMLVAHVRLHHLISKPCHDLEVDYETEQKIHDFVVNVAEAMDTALMLNDFFENYVKLSEIYKTSGKSFSEIFETRLRKHFDRSIRSMTLNEMNNRFDMNPFMFGEYAKVILSRNISNEELEMICKYLKYEVELNAVLDAIKSATR
jgi:hypothetical protein